MYTPSYPTGENLASQNSKSISPKHLTEWVEGSAVSEAIARLNIDSLTAEELNERIRPKHPIKTGGWWCPSVNWRTGVKLGLGQAKPDKPHHPEGQKKAAKYLTPSGMEPDAIFLAMPDKDYWRRVRGDISIPRHWTEGVKKAAAGLTIDLATVALTGVWNWSKDKQLAKEVEHWAQPNTTHYIDFDSDYAANPGCRAAILEFGQLLEKRGCEVYVTVWDDKFKGMDDFIKANGAEAFKEAVANAPSLKEWEEQIKTIDRQNVISHPKFAPPDFSKLEAEIDELSSQDLNRKQLRIKISALAQHYRLNVNEVWKIYHDREQELEQEADRPDVAAEIEALLNAHKSSIALPEVLPIGLAKPIEKLAGMLDLRAECYLVALLAQVSSLFKVGTETMLRRDTDWRCVPNYFAGIVGESSVTKSPIPKAIIDRPMRALKEKAKQEFEQAQANYEAELNSWKAAKKDEERGPAPKPPRMRVYSFDKTTGEGIIYQQAEYAEQALMYFCDELAGLFKSANQYRGGKGSDEEDLLSFWNGSGTTVLRAAGVRASLDAVGLSIFGTIQPDVLAYQLKDCSDSNGKFARFDFVYQPLTASDLPLEDGARFDLTPMLTDLYTKIDALPATFFELDREAKRYFTIFRNACRRRQVAEPKQGLRAAIGKMPEKVGKLATTIHALTCVFEGRQVTNHIPQSAVEAAVKFVKFAADQVASLYTEFSDRTALAPNLAKIIMLAERKGGTVSTREAQHAFPLKQRPSAQQVQEWFCELDSLKYGKVTKTGKTTSFVLTTTTMTTVDLNQDTARAKTDHSHESTLTTMTTVNATTVVNCGHIVVKDIPQSQPLADNTLNPIVVTVVTNSPPLENSDTLMMSCTTEIEHQGTGDIKVGDRVEIVGSDIKHYNGVTGKVADVWARTNSWGCTVDFDKPVGNANFCDFPAYELRKLHDSDG